MTNLKEPKSVQVSPVYVCEKCDSNHYESIEYVNKIGKILCECGEVISLRPILNFKVRPVYANSERVVNKKEHINKTKEDKKEIKETECPAKPEPPPVHNEEIKQGQIFDSDEMFEQSVDFLISLGYKKKEAKKLINSKSKLFGEMKINEQNFEQFANFLLFN